MTTRRGDVTEGFQASDFVFEDRYSTAFVHNAQMEPRSCIAHWEGDKLTLYTPTQGISNCRSDTARDLGIPPEKVQIVCQYMGGGFGNKNQNQDADLITAMLAKEAGAPVKLEQSFVQQTGGNADFHATVEIDNSLEQGISNPDLESVTHSIGDLTVADVEDGVQLDWTAATAAWVAIGKIPVPSAGSIFINALTSRA